ncbi:nucleoside 2-deoxyribosyltransferase [Tetragenococcus osmophilus]|uniref:Nucleoside 2-deoxyribosyltransferase n=1 Tax=Tetragenococcus osmophilus TaxID=526944 RepID=A0AA37XK35_9ENTE|nr:nucleoside 2-deoxyribosyltransferase [Tetragenococcus osmophilus]AYW48669.1 nucleoside 2-deoxyribosyltransferase [Tetragenococcus osmophilus]GMA54617.1 nucleoside deoxyribosyltransferase [Alicyclobacillus contaminans]GMA71551.1 nucleoside deoxyribosyltransferase [Tetragenococcus osmophilus]
MNVYFAAPMFAKSELIYNSYLVEKIRQQYPDLAIYLPQENDTINDKTAYADSKMIALADTQKVEESQLMIALLDGITIDSGVASEVGIAYANHIPILGLYTDSRQQGSDNQQKLEALGTVAENQFHYLNLYTVGLIKLNGQVYSSEEALLTGLNEFLNE